MSIGITGVDSNRYNLGEDFLIPNENHKDIL